jgi:hypothetical protein
VCGCAALALAAGPPAAFQLHPSLVQMAAKNRRLADISKLGDDGADTSLGNPYRRVRVGTRGGLLTMVVSNLTEREDTIP